MAFELTSPQFQNGTPMPREVSCEGGEASPALAWQGAPEGTVSFALILDDPDAPDPAKPLRTFVHWVLFNIPANVAFFPAGMRALPAGTREGVNDGGGTAYVGPCPPIGTHRYFHKLYALDRVLDLFGTPSKADLETAMRGHILGQATLMGTYVK